MNQTIPVSQDNITFDSFDFSQMQFHFIAFTGHI